MVHAFVMVSYVLHVVTIFLVTVCFHRNYYLLYGLLTETVLAVFLAYCPGMDVTLRTYGLRVEWWCTALSFALFIFVFDELRKWIIRKYPGGV